MPPKPKINSALKKNPSYKQIDEQPQKNRSNSIQHKNYPDYLEV